ncbi:MAG: MFS transporter [Spirochaetales bacterium]|nr:MFS transporter [Spirochaetales bacterium]
MSKSLKREGVASYIYSIFKKEQGAIPFLLVLLLQSLAYGFYKGVQDNYLAQIVDVNAFERGVLEFFRELPGLLLIFILAFLYRLSEAKIMKIGIFVMGLGSLGLALIPAHVVPVFFFITIFSFGDHIALPMKSTIALEHSQEGKEGMALGMMNSIVNAGNVTSLLIVSFVFYIFRRVGTSASISSFRLTYLIVAVLMGLSLVISGSMKSKAVNEGRRQRLYFRKKYFKFYMLEVFYGARKQIFLTFAPYVIILHYGADTSSISLLLAISALCSIFCSPLIGKLIDRLGYKTIMVADTIVLVFVCILYGFSHRIFAPNVAFIVVCVNFVLDTVISLASMATNVYVRNISDSQEELTATLTTGISVNHLISIIIAFFGGYIWQVVGIELLFIISAVLGLFNSLFAATVPSVKKKKVIA